MPPSNITFGLVDGRPIFMDIAGDSYFRLSPPQEAAFLADLSAAPACALQISGEDGRLRNVVRASVPRPRATVLSRVSTAGPPAWRDMADVAKRVLRARSAIRRHSIGGLLRALQGEGSGAPAGASAHALAERFMRARRVVPLAHHCLSDSLALLGWLLHAGQSAVLVFGVKLDPFAAHCWLQASDCLLNDRLERVARFTPVAVVPCMPVSP